MAEKFTRKQVQKSIMKMSVISIILIVIMAVFIIQYRDKFNYNFLIKYYSGFKIHKIASLKDMEGVNEKFNTVELVGNDFVNTNIEKKIRRRKRQETAYYYLTHIDNQSMLVLIDSRDKDKIKSGEYAVKGTLKTVDDNIKIRAESLLSKKSQKKEIVLDRYIDTLDEWKIDYGFLYIGVSAVIFFIVLIILRPIWYMINKEKHPLYKKLRNGLEDDEDLEYFDGFRVAVDNYYVDLENKPFENGDTIMVPFIEMLEMIGGQIKTFGNQKDEIKAQISKYQIKLTVDSNIVDVNRKKREMIMAATCIDSIVYVPVTFFSEILNQDVYINPEKRYVSIKEKDSIYSYEQLHYGYSVAAILATYNNEELDILGGDPRCKKYCKMHRESLKEWWGITSRQDLFGMVEKLKRGLHNNIFVDVKDRIEYLSDKEYMEELDKFPKPSQKRDLQIVRKYGKDLGQKGILGWDLSRIITITGGAYLAGFLEYEEANEIIMDVARRVQNTFSSWEEIWQNYLIGYEFWSGDYPEDKESALSERWKIYDNLINDSTSPCDTLNWKLNLNANN